MWTTQVVPGRSCIGFATLPAFGLSSTLTQQLGQLQISNRISSSVSPRMVNELSCLELTVHGSSTVLGAAESARFDTWRTPPLPAQVQALTENKAALSLAKYVSRTYRLSVRTVVKDGLQGEVAFIFVGCVRVFAVVLRRNACVVISGVRFAFRGIRSVQILVDIDSESSSGTRSSGSWQRALGQ